MNIITNEVLDMLGEIDGLTYHDFDESGEWFITSEDLECLFDDYGNDTSYIELSFEILQSGEPVDEDTIIFESSAALLNFMEEFE